MSRRRSSGAVEVAVVAVAAVVDDEEEAAAVDDCGSASRGDCCCSATLSSGNREARVGAGKEVVVAAWLLYEGRGGGAGKAGKKGEEVAAGDKSEGGCWLLAAWRSFGGLEWELNGGVRSIRSAQPVSVSNA